MFNELTKLSTPTIQDRLGALNLKCHNFEVGKHNLKYFINLVDLLLVCLLVNK